MNKKSIAIELIKTGKITDWYADSYYSSIEVETGDGFAIIKINGCIPETGASNFHRWIDIMGDAIEMITFR